LEATLKASQGWKAYGAARFVGPALAAGEAGAFNGAAEYSIAALTTAAIAELIVPTVLLAVAFKLYQYAAQEWGLNNSKPGTTEGEWKDGDDITTEYGNYEISIVRRVTSKKTVSCHYGYTLPDDTSVDTLLWRIRGNGIEFKTLNLPYVVLCGGEQVVPKYWYGAKLKNNMNTGETVWLPLSDEHSTVSFSPNFRWEGKIEYRLAQSKFNGNLITPPDIRLKVPHRELQFLNPIPPPEPVVPPIIPAVPPLVALDVGYPERTDAPAGDLPILPAVPGIGVGLQPGQGTGTKTGNTPGTALPAVAPPIVKPVPAVPQTLPAVDPLPEPEAVIKPQDEFLPGGIRIPATRPPATMKGIATEVGKIEGKLALMLGAEPPKIPGTDVPANWLGKLWEILSNVEPAGSYTLTGPCEVDENGDPIVEIRERPWPLALNPFAALEHRLDALALLLQDHKDLRQPVCKVAGQMQGRSVTVYFREEGGSQRMARSPIRKRLSYRCLVTPTPEELSAHWEGFTWDTGAVQVRLTSKLFGEYQVWATDEEEGRRVIRHALSMSGFNEEDGVWSMNVTTNPRYGVAATVLADHGSARIGPS
jgi:hypothetical protein